MTVVLTAFYFIFIVFHVMRSIEDSESVRLGAPAFSFHQDERYLRRLCRYLLGGRYYRSGNLAVFRTKLHSRDLLVEYNRALENKELTIKLSSTQRFWLRLLPQMEDSQGEIQVGHQAIDERFVIHSDFPEAIKEFFNIATVRELLLGFPHFRRLEFYRGWLRISFWDPEGRGMKPGGFEALLISLTQFLNFYEGHVTPMKVLTAAQHVSSTCPYCRSEFSGEDEQHRCLRCGAGMHMECWKENAGCTTFGCE